VEGLARASFLDVRLRRGRVWAYEEGEKWCAREGEKQNKGLTARATAFRREYAGPLLAVVSGLSPGWLESGAEGTLRDAMLVGGGIGI